MHCFGILYYNLAKLGDGLDERPIVMVGDKTTKQNSVKIGSYKNPVVLLSRPTLDRQMDCSRSYKGSDRHITANMANTLRSLVHSLLFINRLTTDTYFCLASLFRI